MNLRLHRYVDNETKTYEYWMPLPVRQATVAQDFVGAMDSDTVPIVEETLAASMLDQAIAELLSFKREGGIIELVHHADPLA